MAKQIVDKTLRITMSAADGLDATTGEVPFRDRRGVEVVIDAAFLEASDRQPSPYVRDSARAMMRHARSVVVSMVQSPYFNTFTIVDPLSGARLHFALFKHAHQASVHELTNAKMSA